MTSQDVWVAFLFVIIKKLSTATGADIVVRLWRSAVVQKFPTQRSAWLMETSWTHAVNELWGYNARLVLLIG
jgi:hypothetical protein